MELNVELESFPSMEESTPTNFLLLLFLAVSCPIPLYVQDLISGCIFFTMNLIRRRRHFQSNPFCLRPFFSLICISSLMVSCLLLIY